MALSTMALAMSGGVPVYEAPKHRYRDKPTKTPKKMECFDVEIPKGHQVIDETYVFDLTYYRYSITVRLSYGSLKALTKKRIKLQKEIREYIANTPAEALIQFGQFKIEEKEPSLPLTQFINQPKT